jgi:hypothetical protein
MCNPLVSPAAQLTKAVQENAMKHNEAKGDISSFYIRAEDGLRRNPEEYSVYQEILVPLGVIAATRPGCSWVAGQPEVIRRSA